jgi:hypothetical protein
VARRVQLAQQLRLEPVGRAARVARRLRRALVEVGERAFARQERGVAVSEFVLLHEAAAALFGKLRHLAAHALDELRRDDERLQVRLGEVAVVVSLLLRAHDARLGGALVPQARLLRHLSARLDEIYLPLDLELDGALHEAHGVEVLQLDLRPELLLADAAD